MQISTLCCGFSSLESIPSRGRRLLQTRPSLDWAACFGARFQSPSTQSQQLDRWECPSFLILSSSPNLFEKLNVPQGLLPASWSQSSRGTQVSRKSGLGHLGGGGVRTQPHGEAGRGRGWTSPGSRKGRLWTRQSALGPASSAFTLGPGGLFVYQPTVCAVTPGLVHAAFYKL